MAKSTKGRRKKASRRLPTAEEILHQQLEAFREKFGRDPEVGEAVFFDPDQDVPVEMDLDKAFADLGDAMREAGVRPELIYAYEKTGMILIEGKDYDPGAWEEYQAAMREYFALEKAGMLNK